MRLQRRFFLACLLSALVMMALSYAWHGLLLTDLKHIPSPRSLFMAFAAMAYLAIALLISVVYVIVRHHLQWRLNPLLIGALCGFCIYLIAFVFGISFKGSGTEHLLLDFSWQMLEQALGAGVVALVYHFAELHSEQWEEAS